MRPSSRRSSSDTPTTIAYALNTPSLALYWLTAYSSLFTADQFYLTYSEDNSVSDPVSVAYVAPSVTTYTDLNPSYRIYEYNRTDGTILNYQQYYTDLELTSTRSRCALPCCSPARVR